MATYQKSRNTLPTWHNLYDSNDTSAVDCLALCLSANVGTATRCDNVKAGGYSAIKSKYSFMSPCSNFLDENGNEISFAKLLSDLDALDFDLQHPGGVDGFWLIFFIFDHFLQHFECYEHRILRIFVSSLIKMAYAMSANLRARSGSHPYSPDRNFISPS